MNPVVIGAIRYAAANSVNVLGNLIKGYFVHLILLPFIEFPLFYAKPEKLLLSEL